MAQERKELYSQQVSEAEDSWFWEKMPETEDELHFWIVCRIYCLIDL